MFKKTVSLFLVAVMLFCFSACGNKNTNSEILEMDPTKKANVTLTASVTKNALEPIYDNVILFQEGSKVGVIDNKGKVVINAEYTAIEPISTNYYMFQSTAELIGLMNSKGQTVIEEKYHNFIYLNEEYVLAVFDGTYSLFSLPDGKNLKNLDLSDDEEIVRAYLVGEALHLDTSKGATGFKLGNWEKYEFQLLNNDSDRANSYYFNVVVNKEEVTERMEGWDELSEEAKEILGNEYHTYTKVTYELRSADGIVFDKKYHLVCPTSYKDDPIPVSIETDSNGKYEYMYINRNGEVIIQDDFEEISSFNNRKSTAAKKDGYWGLIDKSGKTLTEFIYDNIEYANNGYYLVEINDSYGFIDMNGNTTCPVEITDEKDEGALVFKKNNDAWYTVNPATGEESEKYNYIRFEKDNGVSYFIQDDRMEGLLIYEKEVIPLEYEYAVKISKDGKVFVGSKGSTFDIYEIG